MLYLLIIGFDDIVNKKIVKKFLFFVDLIDYLREGILIIDDVIYLF